jgi:hypothetical protein
MKRKTLLSSLFVVLFLFTCFHTALASDLVGKWSGTLSAGKYEVSASVRFTRSGYKISAAGIASSGSYKLSDGSITLSPSSPAGFSPSTMSIKLKGNRCTISGTVAGLNGTLSLKRKGGSAASEETAEPIASPAPDPEAEALLEMLSGRWTVQWENANLTLITYKDGWAALFLDAGTSDPIPYIYGMAEFADGRLIIRQAAEGAAEAEPVDFSQLLDEATCPEAPLAVALPFEIDPANHLLYVGEAKLPFAFVDGAAEDYQVHPEEPDWKEEE